jgi:uncharacterized protein (DUF58 family)
MAYHSATVSKFEYAKFLAAALVYLAHLQRDSTGLIVFHDDVADAVRPSARQGQLVRLLHGIEHAETGKRTDFNRPFEELRSLLKRRGITVLISDFLADIDTVVKAVEPLRFHGNELILFHLLDREEIEPKLSGPVLLVDMETDDAMEVSPDYAKNEYPSKMADHLQTLQSKAQGAGMEYFLLVTDRPLDAGLREYFKIRERRI